MDFEERERQRRRQMIGVVIAEIGMFLAVIAIVVIATLAAMGFFVTPDGTIEQSGLVQIHSTPTGGTVDLDGSTLFSKTNLTRSLTAGEHKIKISRDNYDTWEKTIKMYSGMLIRLYYPRLFLKNRTPETVERLGQELEFFEPSKDYAYILYAAKTSTKWQMMNIRGDEVCTTTLEMAEVLPGVEKGSFSGKIAYLQWSRNSDRVLIKTESGGKAEWILVDLRDIRKSLNLTRTFGLEFAQVEMIDDSATQLFALEKQNLRKINIADQAVSRVLLSGVENFAVQGSNVIYTMIKNDADAKYKVIGVYKDGERGGTTIAKLKADDQTKVALTKYYDEDYMAFIVNDKMTVYYGALPSYRENVAETDFLNFKVLIDGAQLAVVPEEVSASEEGEYLVMRNGRKFVVADLDMGDLYEYEAGTERISWLNESMLFATGDSRLEVWDFDNTNRRVLVDTMPVESDGNPGAKEENLVTTYSKYPVANYATTIANNNKWLYYVIDMNGELVLRREKVRD